MLEFEETQNNGSTDIFPRNQLIIWDKIVRRTDPKKRLSLYNLRPKYPVCAVNPSHTIAGKQGKLRLYWNVDPWVGEVYDQPSKPIHSFLFPYKR